MLSEQELLAKGDGVFPHTATYGGYRVRRALQVETLWEVEHITGQREFFPTLDKAVTWVEDQVRNYRMRTNLPSSFLDEIYVWKVDK